MALWEKWNIEKNISTGHIVTSDDRPNDTSEFSWRRAVDKNWKQRETDRLRTTYKKLPESWKSFVDSERFPHISANNNELIAFTESEEKGQLDIQKVMKPGKYLNAYFPEVAMEEQRRLVAAFAMAANKNLKLHITKDPKIICQVYKNGPHSCMSGKDEDGDNVDWEFNNCEYDNPAFVYADGDLAVAYIGPASKAKARAVVWPEKKIYNKVYGHFEQMIMLLDAEGYQRGSVIDNEDSRFFGAKIGVVFSNEEKSEIYMPYIDSACFGKVTKDHKYIELIPEDERDDFSIDLHETSGITAYYDERPRCYLSKTIINDRETIVTWNGHTVLKDVALTNGFVFTEDEVWTNNYYEVQGHEKPIIYSHSYLVRNRNLFFEDKLCYGHKNRWYFTDAKIDKATYRDSWNVYKTTLATISRMRPEPVLIDGEYYSPATKKAQKFLKRK